MIFLFPLLYVIAFSYAFVSILRGNKAGILIFFIFGLSIYTTSLSTAFGLGLGAAVPFMQSFKEVLVILLFCLLLFKTNLKRKYHLLDYLILAYFGYTLLYVLIPIGEYSLTERAVAFKSTSFFCLIYTCGRFLPLSEIQISRYFHYILIVAVGACLLSLYEFSMGAHFQTLTNYAEFNYYFYDYEPEGNYGLTWTFEIEGGKMRLASFFSDPLEHAASTLLALAVVAGLATDDQRNIRLTGFLQVAFLATLISIFLALSRASFVSYFLMIYAYAFLLKKKHIMSIFHYGFLALCLYFIFLLNNQDLYEFVIETITFENASSIGHILEWIAGIEAIYQQPLGMGLGASGKVANVLGENIGGENQFIILGVQVGVLGMLLYMFLHVLIAYKAYQWYPKLSNRAKKLAIVLFLVKVGTLIPMLTTNFESYSYFNYVTWFFSGIFISFIMEAAEPKATG